jgi:hypothetical protein
MTNASKTAAMMADAIAVAQANLDAATREVYLTGQGEGWRTEAHRIALRNERIAREIFDAASKPAPVEVDDDGMCTFVV